MSIDDKDGIFRIRNYLDALETAYVEIEKLEPKTQDGSVITPPPAMVTIEVSREEALQLYNARAAYMKERLREFGFTGPIKKVDR